RIIPGGETMTEIGIVIGFLLLSAFFNGSETAFISINRIRLHSRLEENRISARIMTLLMRNSESVIGVFLIAVNICDVAAVLVFNDFFGNLIGRGGLTALYSTLILTPVIALFATLIPKVLFREFAD